MNEFCLLKLYLSLAQFPTLRFCVTDIFESHSILLHLTDMVLVPLGSSWEGELLSWVMSFVLSTDKQCLFHALVSPWVDCMEYYWSLLGESSFFTHYNICLYSGNDMLLSINNMLYLKYCPYGLLAIIQILFFHFSTCFPNSTYALFLFGY